jgi:hypothetical protein
MVQEFCGAITVKTLSNSSLSVNTLADQSFVNRSPRLARVSYAFVPVPQNIGEVLTPSEERLYVKLIGLAQRGLVEPCIRVLASIIERSVRTVQRLLRSLERKGLLAIIERRISAYRNAPNIYKLLGLVFHGGVGDKNATEENRKFLKTTTPAPERGAGGRPDRSSAALLYENRRLQDEVDSLRTLGRYTENGNLWAKFKGWRENKRSEADRMRSEALVGVYNAPVLTAEQQREEKRLWAELEEEIREFDARKR